MLDKNKINEEFIALQNDICAQLEKADGIGYFSKDVWTREEGGGGITRVIEGKIIEKGGVNFSAVEGYLNEQAAKALQTIEGNFFATGVSIVLHPKNPMVPIIHMNIRYFEMNENTWWFGGGIDLTPHYVDENDATFFHQQLKNTCDKFDLNYYEKFKQWADDYFFIKHRNETRGIGGIFFDRLTADNPTQKQNLFDFVMEVGNTFAPTYTHFMQKNEAIPYTENEVNWQYLRRGRYTEFNLVWDRGTKFGLETNGRTESILMSLPPMAKWVYDFKAEPNSKESTTLSLLKKGINWIK